MKPKTLDEIQVWIVNTHRLWTVSKNGKNAALEDCPTEFLDPNEAIEVVKLSDVELRDSHHQKIIADLVSALEDIADYSDESPAYLRAQDQKWATEALAAYKQIVSPIRIDDKGEK